MRKTIAMLVAALALAGCGGGGGGGNTRADPEPERVPDAPEEPVRNPEPSEPPPDPVLDVPGTNPLRVPEPPEPPEPPAPALPERSASRIPGLGDYAPVDGAAVFRNDPDYRGLDDEGTGRNWALDRVRAADAYARLGSGVVPGAGIRIAVVDDGVDTDHWELMPAFDADRLTATGIIGGRAGIEEFKFSHGTAVTGLILANKHGAGRDPDTSSFHGIAYGAHVDVYGIPLGSGSGDYAPPSRADWEARVRGAARARVQMLKAATENDPRIVNMSFTNVVMAEQYLEDRAATERGLTTLLDFVKGEQGTIFVQSAGNSNGDPCAKRTSAGCASGNLEATSPAFIAALPMWDRSGEVGKRWVAVVATDSDNAMADFSNRCGLAARWCLAAPGVGINIAYYGPDTEGNPARTYTPHSGTSFSASLVSGGLAVVKQYFGNTLTMEEVLSRVYATADKAPDTVPDGSVCPAHLDTDGDRSDCELSSTHGQGLMNLERATRPVGAMTGHGALVDAGGGAIADALAGVDPVVFDSLGYPFRQPLEAQVTVAASAPGSIPDFAEGDDAGRPSWSGLHWREATRGRTAAGGGARGPSRRRRTAPGPSIARDSPTLCPAGRGRRAGWPSAIACSAAGPKGRGQAAGSSTIRAFCGCATDGRWRKAKPRASGSIGRPRSHSHGCAAPACCARLAGSTRDTASRSRGRSGRRARRSASRRRYARSGGLPG